MELVRPMMRKACVTGTIEAVRALMICRRFERRPKRRRTRNARRRRSVLSPGSSSKINDSTDTCRDRHRQTDTHTNTHTHTGEQPYLWSGRSAVF